MLVSLLRGGAWRAAAAKSMTPPPGRALFLTIHLRIAAPCALLRVRGRPSRGVKMRPLLPAFLLLTSAAALAQPAEPPAADVPGAAPREGFRGLGFRGPRGGLFLSPMGEPFRSADPAADNVGAWFAQADADHDGALTLAEMQADAARFYATLDVNHDGEI